MPNKSLTQHKHTRCEQLGVCQAYGTCTQCLVAPLRHPFAPGVIEAAHEPRSFVIAVRCLVVLALICLASVVWLCLDLAGAFNNLWLLAA